MHPLRRRLLSLALWPCALATSLPAPAQDTPLENASWIWAAGEPGAAPAPTCFFRRPLRLDAPPARAELFVTADNVYELYVNGTFVGGDGDAPAVYWRSIERYDLTPLLREGTNVVAVEGTCLGGAAGLAAALSVELEGGGALALHTDGAWRLALARESNWRGVDFDDRHWSSAAVVAPVGEGLWGPLTYPEPVSPGALERPVLLEPGPDFVPPAGVVFVADSVPVSDPAALNIFRIGRTRAYFENDVPSPAALGRKLYALVPAGPGSERRLLFDAGEGVLGSPSVSFDGRRVYFTLAPAGEPFFHVWRLDLDSGDDPAQVRLTDGPFHDYDPCELPDGRVVFSSTRLGGRDEYHGNVASSLFVLDPADGTIEALTSHIVGDREPRVTADGGLVFIRSDNFLERAKVETHLHRTRLDGSGGTVLLGLERGAIGYDPVRAAEHNAAWLREFGAGSPAPLPDGRVAAITQLGLVLAGPGGIERVPVAPTPYDVAALPDGRLLCTLPGRDGIGVLDPRSGAVTLAHAFEDVHSVTYLGPRPRPPQVASLLAPADGGDTSTGYLLCQNAWRGKQTAADRGRIRAVRVLEGRPLTERSVGHHLVHIGVEAVELGSVPLAPDGSFYVEVPADRPLALQAVDAQGRAVVSEMSWIYVRPGERRSCVGCHEARRATPAPGAGTLATRAASLALVPLDGPGGAHRFRGNNAANGGVLNLQLDRFREAASIDLYTDPTSLADGAACWRAPGRRWEVEALVARLEDPEPAARAAAARRLAVFRDRTASAPLAALLARDDDPAVRCAAALALAACAERDATGALLDALSDEHPLVAQAAAVALENMTAARVDFDPFGPDRAPGVAAWRARLADDAWPAIEARLAEAVRGEGTGTPQLAAVEALGHGCGPAGRAALLAALERAGPEDELRTVLATMRALGHLREERAVPLLARVLRETIHVDPGPSPFLHELGWTARHVHRAAAAAEALGWIGGQAAEGVLLDTFPELRDFWIYTFQTGDHDWLRGCQSSLVHHRFLEALDALGSGSLAPLVPATLRSLPIDPDRGLLTELDSYELLVARVVQRAGRTAEVLEAALAVLGDPDSGTGEELRAGVAASPPATEVKPQPPEARAAQVLSVVCADGTHAGRVRAALDRFRAQEPSRTRSYVCFYLCRALGRMNDPASVEHLSRVLTEDPPEARLGLAAPPSAFVYRATPPFHRAAAAAALGWLGDRRASATLLDVAADFDNALSVRHAAAAALATACDPEHAGRLRTLAETYPEVVTRRALLGAARAVDAR